MGSVDQSLVSKAAVRKFPRGHETFGEIYNAKQRLSDQILERYREKSLPGKSREALENVIRACDFLEKQQLEITVAAVGAFCNRKPKTQSIRNNRQLKDYVVARRVEQSFPSTGGRKGCSNPARSGDLNIDSYIQTLESELVQVKTELRSLRHAIPRLGDYDFKAAIESGQLVINVPNQRKLPPEAVAGIKTLFDTQALAAVGLVYMPTGQVVAPELNDAMLLSKPQMDALRSVLEEERR